MVRTLQRLVRTSTFLERVEAKTGDWLNDYLASTGCSGVVHESFTTTFVAEELAGGAVEVVHESSL